MSMTLKGTSGPARLPVSTKQIRLVPIAAVLLVMIAAPAVVRAQAAASASITGRITDATGGAVPDAAVSVTGPALQVSAVNVVTDQDGNYRVLDLPAPGVYRVAFAHPGFETVVHPDLNLSVGFAARVDAVMKVGQVEQTVEVTDRARSSTRSTIPAARLCS